MRPLLFLMFDGVNLPPAASLFFANARRVKRFAGLPPAETLDPSGGSRQPDEPLTRLATTKKNEVGRCRIQRICGSVTPLATINREFAT